jgi:benzoate membrane transport protein
MPTLTFSRPTTNIPPWRPMLRDVNAAALSAGVATFIWYAVGMVPVQISSIGQFGLDPAQASSWLFIIWTSGAISSITLSILYRQPIPITSTIPGLLFMATMAGSYSYPELVGANLIAGVIVLTLGLFRVGGRLLDWLPMPLAMGMLGGSILGDVSRAVSATVGDVVVAGATVAGYLVGRTIRNQKIPPVTLALGAGGVAVFMTHNFGPVSLAWQMPNLVMPPMSFSLTSFFAVSLPMIVLSVGLGNAQGLGFLRGQGYRVPANVITFVLGLNSIINALFGGHAAIVSRNGMPIMASTEAGPVAGRYWANLTSAAMTLLIAVAAYPVASLVSVLPTSYVLALAGVAILPSFQNAVEQAFVGKLRFGAIVAFVISCTPFSLLGISSAFWALIGGIVASLICERADLVSHWRRADPGNERREQRLPVELRPSATHIISGRRRVPVTAQVRNLSEHGLSVTAEQQLSPGDQLELSFSMPDGGADVAVRVDVRHVNHLADGPVELWEAGCEFRTVTSTARERLAALLLEHSAVFAAPTGSVREVRRSGPALSLLRPGRAPSRTSAAMDAEMIRGIAQDEFKTYYQPIISFETFGIVEVEALMRWEHPERGLIEPGRFLPLAEQAGLMVSLGQRVLETGCRDVREWQSLHGGTSRLSLAVNLSTQQLHHPDLAEDIAQALWCADLDPTSLSLELSEATLLADPELTNEVLRQFKRLGIRVVLDDFGTGPSSLRHLSQLPIDALKIDTSLIRNLDADGPQLALVKSIMGVAQSLRLDVTAEGVETWGQQTQLCRLGCQRGQGFFFAQPMPGRDVPDLLSASFPALLAPSARALSA